MANIRPNQLPPATTITNNDRLIIDQGAAGVNAAPPKSLLDTFAPVATQAEAEDGTDNVKRMTPLRAQQHLLAQGVPNTRAIIAGDGLAGGGTLDANLELALSSTSLASLALADSAVQSVNGKSGSSVTLTKADVGLSNVDNTSDAAKPISTATQTALNAKANSSVTITAGAGLTGGGNLTANRTVALDAASIASLGKADTALQAPGGVSGQVLVKQSAADNDVAWVSSEAATAVSYGPQTLTPEQQAQARQNIQADHAYDTIADITSATVPAYANAIRTNGYYAAGDGGGAMYKRVTSEPSHAGKLQSADGVWWELAESTINSRMFGAKGDGVADDTAALQACFSHPSKSIHEAQGTYVISAEIESSVADRSITSDGFWTANVFVNRALRITGERTKVQLNILGNRMIANGIQAVVGGCIIEGCYVENLARTLNNNTALRADTNGGVIIRRNTVIGNFNPLTENPPELDINATSRAIVVALTDHAIRPSVISDNYIDGSFSELMSSIQTLAYAGGGADRPFLRADCTITGNTIKNFTRRGIKVESSTTYVTNNTLLSKYLNSELIFPGAGIDAFYAYDVDIIDNNIECWGMTCISAAGGTGEGLSLALRFRVNGNSCSGRTETSAINIYYAIHSEFNNNRITGGQSGIAMGYTVSSTLKGNTIGGQGDPTNGRSINLVNCTDIVMTDTVILNNSIRGPVHIHIANSNTRVIIDGIYNLTDTIAVLVGVNSVDCVVRNIVSTRAAPITGTKTNLRTFSAINVGAGEAKGSQVPSVYFTTGSPQTETPTQYYTRGDVSFNINAAGGGKAGWICTESGAPGTWKAFGVVDA